jgi:hypothetical protein
MQCGRIEGTHRPIVVMALVMMSFLTWPFDASMDNWPLTRAVVWAFCIVPRIDLSLFFENSGVQK